MDKYQQLLKEYWGFEDFRGIQREIIESIGSGHDTLGLMPTGGGKSLTFQIPALASEGICIVITPLIALMKDQVAHLREKGIKAAAIYMGMTHEKVIITLENCIFGDYKLLYISPERIGSELFQIKLSHMKVSFICVDEAHCISQWGYDFRPSYLRIKDIRKLVPHAPVLALTATATPNVVHDIQQQLEFPEERVFRMSFERKNLAYKVYRVENKEGTLKRMLNEREGSAIIYCRNRQQCKELSEKIQEWGHSATYYHAGIKDSEKDSRQRQWQSDKIRVMVATNAFGMGIDKAEVRLVVHMSLPNAIESYFQEAGRAGRDGNPAEAILLYEQSDLSTLKKRVNETYPDKNLMRDIYEEVCCYLQIAVGFGLGHRREFNLQDFCVKFHHFPTLVESTLNLLTKAGYINYTDTDEPISRLMFEVTRDQLYYIKDVNPNKSKVIQALLRHYTGLFVKHMPIDEDLLSSVTGMTPTEVYHTLRSLTKQHILSYIPKKNVPHITFTSDRREKDEVFFPKSIYDNRKEILQQQINAMLEYAIEDEICRSRYLLEYFGEKRKDECGQCDVCIDNQKVPSTKQYLINIIGKAFHVGSEHQKEKEKQRQVDIIKEDILQQLQPTGKLHPFAIEVDKYDPELVREAIDQLTDEDKIKMDENLWICLQ